MHNGESLRSRFAVVAASALVFVSLSATGAARLDAVVQLSNQNNTVATLVPDMALRTGDAVRFRISSETSAYVYLIAVGSSGTARVLQPLSGKPADAWMGAGEERNIPREGEFLPLDKQTGSEIVLILSSPAPIPNLTRILVRLEDATPDLGAMQRVLDNAGLDAEMLAFRHLEALTAPAPPVPAPPQVAANRTTPLVDNALPTEQVAIERNDGQDTVLGGLGSRISAFQSNQSLPPQLGAESSVQIENINPFQDEPSQTPAADNDDDSDKEPGLGSTLASWFGLGSDPEPEPEKTRAKIAAQATADTFPLQTRDYPPTPNVLTQPKDTPLSTPDSLSGQDSEPVNGEPEIQAPVETQGSETAQLSASRNSTGVILVEPAAVEKSLQDSVRQPPGSVSDTALDADSSEPEIPQNGRTAEILASLFGPTSVAGDRGGTAISAPEEAAPLPEPDTLTTDNEGVAEVENSPTASSPVIRQSAAGEDDAQTQVDVDTQENASATTAEQEQEQEQEPATAGGGGLFGWLTGSSEDSAQDNTGSTPIEAGGSTPGTDTELVENGNSNGVSTVTETGTATAQTSATVAIESDVQTPVEPEQAETPPENAEPANTGGGGLFGWLAGNSEVQTRVNSDESETEDSEPTQTQRLEIQADDSGPETENPGLAQQEQEVVKNSSSGLFSWLTNPQQDSVAADAELPSDEVLPPPPEESTAELPGDEVLPPPPEESTAELPSDEVLPPQQEEITAELPSDEVLLPQQEEITAELPRDEILLPQPEESTAGLPSDEVLLPQQAEPAPPRPGFLAGLAALFGGGDADTVPEVETKAVDSPPRKNPTPSLRNKSVETPAPAMTRRKNARGESVVMLSGPETPPSQVMNGTRGNSEVLSGQGSRIQALLAQGSTATTQQQSEPAPVVVAGAATETVVPDPGPIQGESIVIPAEDSVATDSEPVPSEPSEAPAPPPTAAASSRDSPEAVQSPLQLNPQESQRNVTRLALNAAPVQALKEATESVRDVDLSDDDGLAGAVVLVISPTGTGAGVVINEAGQILTNWHLVRGLDSVAVAFKRPGEARISTSNLRRARVLRHSKYPDLALLDVDGGSPVTAARVVADQAGRVEPARGARLHTLSLSDSGAWQTSVVKVERVRSGSSWYSGRRVLHRATVIRANFEGQSGLSGAPLFNENGEITGMTTLVKTGKNQLIAVSAQTLRRFLTPPE